MVPELGLHRPFVGLWQVAILNLHFPFEEIDFDTPKFGSDFVIVGFVS